MAMLTVGAILREPLETTLRFVSWYLDAGADQIVLCFDDPLDPAIEVLRRNDVVTHQHVDAQSVTFRVDLPATISLNNPIVGTKRVVKTILSPHS